MQICSIVRYIVHTNDETNREQDMQPAIHDEDSNTGFPVPFTKDEFKNDILETMLVLINQTRFTFIRSFDTDSVLWSLLSKKPLEYPSAYADPDLRSNDLNLTFSDIEDIEIVQDLIEFYDYGIHGIINTSRPSMDDSDGSGNWTSRILYDLRRSLFLEDWSGYKSYSPQESVDRCLKITEIANARLILEGGGEGFFLGTQDAGVLDIHQMALLSGMTEGSIRTLANPARKNPLITTKMAEGTFVKIEDAKAWLKAKGRYVPIKKTRESGAEDFTARKFESKLDFEAAIYDRIMFLSYRDGAETVASRIAATGVVPLAQDNARRLFLGCDEYDEAQLLNAELMCRFAGVLELQPELFALRAAEAVTLTKLRMIEMQLKQVQQTQPK